MTELDRRRFLLSAPPLAAGVLALPGWLRAAFAQDPAESGHRRKAVRDGWRRATALGKPLLVLVVPEDARRRDDRGHLLGALLQHGGDPLLLDLALAEVACATRAEAADVLGVEAANGEPLALLFEHVVDHVQVRAVAPEPKEVEGIGGTVEHDKLEQIDDAIRAQVKALATAVHDALAKDQDALRARSVANRAALTADDNAAVDALASQRVVPAAELLLRAAPAVRLVAALKSDTAERERVLAPLLAATRAAFVDARIPGSMWATGNGCGMQVEGIPDQAMIACGMGAVPSLSRRFLVFYVQ